MDLEFDVDDLRDAVGADLWSHLSEQLGVTPLSVVCDGSNVPNDDTPLAALGLTEHVHALIEVSSRDADELERSVSYETSLE